MFLALRRALYGWAVACQDGDVAPQTALRRVPPAAYPVVERLWQLYRHDLSEFRGSMPAADGAFPARRLMSYFGDPDRRAYLFYSGSSPSGFALVRGVRDQPRVVGEFFVVRALRRQRVGHEAALELVRAHPGRWEIAFQEENPGAACFWRHVAMAAGGDAWREERRPVPGRPDVPPDVWIILNSYSGGTR